ncbi:MAG: glycosyltransferase family 39 protein [Nitrososphaerales archaeon]
MASSEGTEKSAANEVGTYTKPIEETIPKSPDFDDKVKQFVIRKLDSFNIGHLLLILTGLHLFAMSFPNDVSNPGSYYVFDESYYVPAAKDLLNLVPSNLEHPFFGKIWGALGIYLFGNDFFGWRIFYVAIGVLSVWALYELALNFFSKEKALFAASMLGFETLFFIHTSLDLLEGPAILFALLGFLAYFKRRYYWAAAAFGLSVLSKEWGVYFVVVLFLYHVWATKRDPIAKLLSGPSLRRLLMFIVIGFLMVSLPLWVYDAAYHPYTQTVNIVSTEYIVNPSYGTTVTTTITNSTHSGYLTNPLQNFLYYFTYASSLKVTQQDIQQYPWVYLPWMWILPFGINPQQYYVTTVTVTTTGPNNVILGTKQLHPIDWLGIGNLVVWYSIWITVPVLIAKALMKRITQLDALIGAWIFGTYGPTLFEYFAFQRVEYPFYFVNVDPGLALGIPMVIAFIAPDSLKLQRLLMLFWLAAAIIFFVLFFPVHPLAFS